jgi:hypothetical protein
LNTAQYKPTAARGVEGIPSSVPPVVIPLKNLCAFAFFTIKNGPLELLLYKCSFFSLFNHEKKK